MDLYSCNVNLFSKNQNQVAKTEVTAAEIAILRAIHSAPHEGVGGHDPVTNIVKTGEAQRTDDEERARLIGDDQGKDGHGAPMYKEKFYRMVFPNDFTPLPQVVPGMEKAKAVKPAKKTTVSDVLNEDETFA